MTITNKVTETITAFLDVIFGLAFTGNIVTKVLSTVTKTMAQHDVIPDVCTTHPVTKQLNEDEDFISTPKTALMIRFNGAEHNKIVSLTANTIK
jgi:hypothetical protein